MAIAWLTATAALAQVPGTVDGDWRCVWTDARGHIYECVMRLSVDPDGRVEGRIDWTLLRSPRAEDRAKIGLIAVEYVRGRVTSAESLFFEGHAEDDPDGIRGLDRYPLQLTPSGAWMFGRTESGGAWNGQFYATRQ